MPSGMNNWFQADKIGSLFFFFAVQFLLFLYINSKLPDVPSWETETHEYIFNFRKSIWLIIGCSFLILDELFDILASLFVLYTHLYTMIFTQNILEFAFYFSQYMCLIDCVYYAQYLKTLAALSQFSFLSLILAYSYFCFVWVLFWLKTTILTYKLYVKSLRFRTK